MALNEAERREMFLIRPDVVFLNHGSFGACPRPVFERYQAWQLELERQPVEFLGRRYGDLMQTARRSLGDYLGTSGYNLFFVPNATTGLNTVIRALDLQPGDEILSNDQEYGALHRTWEFICKKRGATYIRQKIDLPVVSPEAVVEQIWQGVSTKTKVLFLSHITSSSGLTLPIRPLIERAKAAGILTMIDGAHAPGQIPLNLEELDADFYSGNCHKWLMAPKGSAFLYAHPRVQHLVEPLVVSWNDISIGKSDFLKENDYQGTKDISPYLTVPAAIDFQKKYDWENVREECHQLVCYARREINKILQQPPLSPEGEGWFQQMSAHFLPESCDGHALKATLMNDFSIEIPVTDLENRQFLRISVQGYNTQADVDALLNALKMISC